MVSIVWLLVGLIFLISSIAFLGLVIYINTLRKKYKHLYCPTYTSFLLAHLNEIIKAKGDLAGLMLKWSKESGDDIFVLFSSWRVHVHVVDTNKIKQILGSSTWFKPKAGELSSFCRVPLVGMNSMFTESGTEHWFKKRRMFDPFFHANGLRSKYEHIVDISDDLIKSIEKNNTDGPVNLTKTMQKYVSFVIAKVVLEIHDQQEFYSYTPGIASVFSGISIRLQNKNTFWLPWKHRSLKESISKDLLDLRSYFKKRIMTQLEGTLEPSSVFAHVVKSNVVGDQLMMEDTINDMVMFFVAGIDTSMHTINFSFYEMLRNRDAFNQIEQEVLDVYAGKTKISYEEIKELKILDTFIREVLRYHPIVMSSHRVSGATDRDLMGIRIPRNSNVHVNILCVQQCERYWQDPLLFSLEHWSKSPEPFSYIPFSGGTRSCIGKQLALLEIKVFISSIIRRFTIDFEGSDLSDIKTTGRLTRRLAKDLHVKFIDRET